MKEQFQELFNPEDLEQKYKFVLVGKTAIRFTGNWQSIFEREVRLLCPWGLKIVRAGQYPQVYATESSLLFKGYTLIKDESNPDVVPIQVNEVRMKLIRAMKPEVVPEYL